MKKLISLILVLTLTLMSPACSKNNGNEDIGGSQNSTQDNSNQSSSSTQTIVVPEYKDYGRNTEDFSKLVYSRPDLEIAIQKFNEAAVLVTENSLPIEEQIEAIRAIEPLYTNAESMYALTEIYSKKDSSVEFWQNELLYVSSGYPAFVKAVEDLLVACATSEHKEIFENEYFNYSLDEYVDGGSYTDELVALLEQEAIKESEYSSLSTATVTIKYDSVGGFSFEGTVDEVYKQAEEKYGKDSTQYKNATIVINGLYAQRVNELSRPIYIDLLKIRRLIADELGFDSYVEFAYKNMGYDYSADDMNNLLGYIGAYIAPVAERLNSVTFTSYFQKNNQPRIDSVTLINNLYSVYSADSDLSNAYSYMLQHGLYDVSTSAPNRFNGAFTTYIESNSSPFVFMSSSGFIRDYTTLSHEFGHFYDGYVNYGDNASIDLAEVSSQGLEYLTLLRLRSKLKMTDYEYLEYLTLYTVLNSVLLEQSFYATFEHMAYSLEYDEISSKKLSETAREAFLKVYGRELEQSVDALKYVIIPHTILYPFYVESYVSSAIPALEIFFKESYRTGSVGDGLNVYKQIVKRENVDATFTEVIESAGLASPFEQETIRKIANLIHYQILGTDYFTSTDSLIGAA